MSKTNTERPVPENVSVETLNNILIGFLRSGASQNAVHYLKVSEITAIPKTVISRNHKFFVASGFLNQEKRGFLKFTNLGSKYVQSLDWGRLDEAKEYLRNILNDYELIKQIYDYIDIKNTVDRDDLISRIAILSDVKRSSRFETGINALLDLALFSNIFLEDNSNIIINKNLKKISTYEIMPIDEEGIKETVISAPKKEFEIPINININITDISDINRLKEILKIIKEVFEEK